jgi:hypothetical protein
VERFFNNQNGISFYETDKTKKRKTRKKMRCAAAFKFQETHMKHAGLGEKHSL